MSLGHLAAASALEIVEQIASWLILNYGQGLPASFFWGSVI